MSKAGTVEKLVMEEDYYVAEHVGDGPIRFWVTENKYVTCEISDGELRVYSHTEGDKSIGRLQIQPRAINGVGITVS